MKELEEIRTRLEAEEAFENSAEIGLNLLAALEAALATADALIEENQDATTLQSWGLMTAARKIHATITEALT